VPLVAQARLHEDVEQRLDDPLCAVRIGIPIRDGVKAGRQARQLDRLHHRIGELVALRSRAHVQVEVGHPHQALDVRPADERAADERNLLVQIRLDRESRKQRLQQRFGIDVNPRLRFVHLGCPIHHEHADDRGDPCRAQTDPAPLPHPAQVGE
jgi:hypothetical protein